MRPEHHLRVVCKILVDLDDALAFVTPRCAATFVRHVAGRKVLVVVDCAHLSGLQHQFAQVHPIGAPRFLSLAAALKHQNVDNHLGPGGRTHRAFRQARGADQVRQAGNVLAGGRHRLVHRPGAGDEQRYAARPQPADGAGDEVVVQAQTKGGGRRIRADDAVRERRVADREIEAPAEGAACVILASHAGLGMDQGRDAGGDGVVFHPGQAGGFAQGFRQQGEEQASPHPWLEDPPAVKAEMLGGAPKAADHRLGGVVGILRCPLQGGVFRRCRDAREVTADLLPARPETVGTGQREAILGQVRGAEADEA